MDIPTPLETPSCPDGPISIPSFIWSSSSGRLAWRLPSSRGFSQPSGLSARTDGLDRCGGLFDLEPNPSLSFAQSRSPIGIRRSTCGYTESSTSMRSPAWHFAESAFMTASAVRSGRCSRREPSYRWPPRHSDLVQSLLCPSMGSLRIWCVPPFACGWIHSSPRRSASNN